MRRPACSKRSSSRTAFLRPSTISAESEVPRWAATILASLSRSRGTDNVTFCRLEGDCTRKSVTRDYVVSLRSFETFASIGASDQLTRASLLCRRATSVPPPRRHTIR